MRLQQIVGKSSVPDLVRYRLERSTFHSNDSAARALQREFPNHIITPHPGEIEVRVKDRSFSIAVFKTIL